MAIFINKKDEYEKLVQDVATCKKCDQVKLKNKSTTIELIHDEYRIEINLWAHWQGNLDADILVIGQDWGRINSKEDATYWRNKKPYLTTDKTSKEYSITDNNLQKLFLQSLGIDISISNDKVFFTNSVQCYKTGSLSNKTSDKWHQWCNELFVKRLIHIIKPKIIIPIGQKALNGLKYCGTIFDANNNLLNDNYFNMKFANIVDNGFLKLKSDYKNENIEMFVCPVFHCGAMSCNLNRKYDKQLEDWDKIKELL